MAYLRRRKRPTCVDCRKHGWTDPKKPPSVAQVLGPFETVVGLHGWFVREITPEIRASGAGDFCEKCGKCVSIFMVYRCATGNRGMAGTDLMAWSRYCAGCLLGRAKERAGAVTKLTPPEMLLDDA